MVDSLRTILSFVAIGLHLVTIDLVDDNGKYEGYFQVLYPLWVVDSLGYHWLPLATTDLVYFDFCIF